MFAVAFSSMIARAKTRILPPTSTVLGSSHTNGDGHPPWICGRSSTGKSPRVRAAGTSGGGTMLEVDQASGSNADLARSHRTMTLPL